jgi:hypothetical protein
MNFRIQTLKLIRPLTRNSQGRLFSSTPKPDLTAKVSETTIAVDKYSLSPHQLWITQGKHMERPFTGHFWDCSEVGQYKCFICDSKLFT